MYPLSTLSKAYDSIDRTLLWTVLARFGVPHGNSISVLRQFRDGIRACVRLDGRVCSGWFVVEQGLRQGCVLAPLLFNIFTAVLNVASTRFKVDKGIMDALMQPRKKKGAGGRGRQLPDSQSWRRCVGACFMLTMPGSSCNHPSSCER